MTLQKNMIDFSQLVTISHGQVQMRRQTNIIRRYFCKFFNLRNSWYRIYFWDRNLLFLMRSNGVGILDGYYN